MKLKHLLAGAALAATALAGAAASAGVIFDSGAIDGTSNAFYIDGPNSGPYGQSIYDTFTATGSGTLGELDVGLWVSAGATPTTLTWWLGSTPFDNSLGGGTVALSAADYVFHNGPVFGYDVYNVKLTGLSSAMLNAGSTYVLTLGNGNDSSGGQRVAWDLNNGPTTCGWTVGGIDQGDCGFGGEAFTLKSGSVPEPASWALMLMGFGGLGAMLRRRRTVALAA